MGFKVKELPQAGGWFKPDEHVNDVAILIEVERVERQRPTQFGPKDTVYATATFFATQADLDSGTPSEVAKGMAFDKAYHAADLIRLGVGEATIVTIGQKATKKGNDAWCFLQPTAENKAKVIAYGEAREAAKAEAIAAAPSFD